MARESDSEQRQASDTKVTSQNVVERNNDVNRVSIRVTDRDRAVSQNDKQTQPHKTREGKHTQRRHHNST
jgi:hypothetical protein